jgi:hypothetical protein
MSRFWFFLLISIAAEAVAASGGLARGCVESSASGWTIPGTHQWIEGFCGSQEEARAACEAVAVPRDYAGSCYLSGDSSISGGWFSLIRNVRHIPFAHAKFFFDTPQVNSCPKDGNPCVPATGAKEYNRIDFEWSGLSFERNYTSLGQFSLTGGWGNNWSHSFSHRLYGPSASGAVVVWVDHRGHFDRFIWEPSVGVYRAVNNVGTILRPSSGSEAWSLIGPNRELGFDLNGRLVRVGSNFERVDIAYCGANDVQAGVCVSEGVLKSATDTRGRTLRFEYEATIAGSVGSAVTPAPSRLVWDQGLPDPASLCSLGGWNSSSLKHSA